MFDEDDFKRFDEGLVYMPKPRFNEVAQPKHEKVIVVEQPPSKGGSIVDIPQTERKVFDVKCK